MFQYGDDKIGNRETFFTTASVVLGLGVLTLPRTVTRETMSSDGWICIIIAGFIAILLAWLLAKLASRFHSETFFSYSSRIVSKPLAYLFTLSQAVTFLLFFAVEVRGLSIVAKQYLFDDTPIEAIALVFLLIIVYGVSGSSAGLIRLNVLFLPFIFVVVVVVLVMNIRYFEPGNLKPIFITNWGGILSGIKTSIFSYQGFEVILYYAFLIKNPKQAPRYAAAALLIPLLTYILLYVSVIAALSVEATMQVNYPTIELAKAIELPGEFFERFESIFFTIWIMTLFNTASMLFYAAISAVRSMFPQWPKPTLIFIFSPLVYIISFIPQSEVEFGAFSDFISLMSLVCCIAIPILIYIVAIVRGVRVNG